MIETATQTDLPEIQALIEQEFPYLQKPKETLAKKITDPKYTLFVIRQASQFAGFSETEELKKNKSIRLNALAIHPDYRKKGLGQQLLQFTLGFLRTKQFETVEILVKRNNTIARELYEKNGFAWKDTFPQYIDRSVVEEYELRL